MWVVTFSFKMYDFQIPSRFAWKSFYVKICISAWFFAQSSRSKFQTSLYFPHFCCGIQSALGEGKFGQMLAKFCCRQSPKMPFCSFWQRGDNLLGHLDRRASLGEALEPLESVVDENPVLVRLTGVVIWGSSWKWECWISMKVKVNISMKVKVKIPVEVKVFAQLTSVAIWQSNWRGKSKS